MATWPWREAIGRVDPAPPDASALANDSCAVVSWACTLLTFCSRGAGSRLSSACPLVTVDPLMTLTAVTVTGAVTPVMFRPTENERFWAGAVVPTPPGLALMVAGPAVETTTAGTVCDSLAATATTMMTTTRAATPQAASPRLVWARGSFARSVVQPERSMVPAPRPVSRKPWRTVSHPVWSRFVGSVGRSASTASSASTSGAPTSGVRSSGWGPSVWDPSMWDPSVRDPVASGRARSASTGSTTLV